jgi:hypothetical protein
MAKKQPITVSADVSAAALQETLRLRAQYQAERDGVQAQIVSFGNMFPEADDGAAPTLAERMKQRLNGHAVALSVAVPDGIRLRKLLNDREELDGILAILNRDETAKRAAFAAAYSLDQTADWDAADRRLGEAMLQLLAAATEIFKQDRQTLTVTGWQRRGRPVDGPLARMFPSFYGSSIIEVIEALTQSGAVSQRDSEASLAALRDDR